MTFECHVVPEDCRFAVIFPLYTRVKERGLNVRMVKPFKLGAINLEVLVESVE